MITTSDNIIQETIFDHMPLSISLLKKLGWIYKDCPEPFATWTEFHKKGVEYPYLERYSGGDYFMITGKNKEGFFEVHQVYTVKDVQC